MIREDPVFETKKEKESRNSENFQNSKHCGRIYRDPGLTGVSMRLMHNEQWRRLDETDFGADTLSSMLPSPGKLKPKPKFYAPALNNQIVIF